MTKKILTLLSVFCGAAVVGTTFAAWAVTDNADPFGIKVTPGGSIVDDTKFVTLSYGDTFTAENLTGLAVGTVKLGAAVGLKATTAGDSYTGKFEMDLEDLTEHKKEGDAKLIDNLVVKLYSKDAVDLKVTGGLVYDPTTRVISTDLSDVTPDGEIQPVDPYEFAKTYTVNSGVEHVVYVTVTLKSGISPAVIDQIQNDYVRINMDWNKGSDKDVLATPIYFNGESNKTYYCYAWTDSGAKNADWPGVAMTHDPLDVDTLYNYTLGTQYTNVIFHDNVEGGYKTLDQKVTSDIRANRPCFDKTTGAWRSKVVPTDLDKDYYLVGTFTDPAWAAQKAYGLSPVAGVEGKYQITNQTLAAGTKLKIRDKGDTVYRSSKDYWGNVAAEIDNEGNIVLKASGVYTINFFEDGQNENYVELVKDTVYYLVGNKDYMDPTKPGDSWNDYTKAKPFGPHTEEGEFVLTYTFAADDEFRVKSDGQPAAWGTFEAGDLENQNAFTMGQMTLVGDNAKVVTAGEYTIYYKAATNSVWVEQLATD